MSVSVCSVNLWHLYQPIPLRDDFPQLSLKVPDLALQVRNDRILFLHGRHVAEALRHVLFNSFAERQHRPLREQKRIWAHPATRRNRQLAPQSQSCDIDIKMLLLPISGWTV